VKPIDPPDGQQPETSSGPLHRAWAIADIEGHQKHLLDEHPEEYGQGPARDRDGNLIIRWEVDPASGEEVPHVARR
jgi:hypothetical protein